MIVAILQAVYSGMAIRVLCSRESCYGRPSRPISIYALLIGWMTRLAVMANAVELIAVGGEILMAFSKMLPR